MRGQRLEFLKLVEEARREAVKNLTDEGLSTREIADVIGTSHQTVANTVKDLTDGRLLQI